MRTPQMRACLETGCGKHYLSIDGRDRGRCPECRQKQRQKRISRQSSAQNTAFTLEIVHDPLRPGGFNQGVVFEKVAVKNMLQAKAFTTGTQVRDLRQGRIYQYNGYHFVKMEA